MVVLVPKHDSWCSRRVLYGLKKEFLHKTLARLNVCQQLRLDKLWLQSYQIKKKLAYFLNHYKSIYHKVEKILKGSLDSTPSPSPSVKIQIMGGKVCLRCKDKTLLGDVNKLLVFKKMLATPSNAFTPQANFPAHNFNFHGRWRWIQTTYL